MSHRRLGLTGACIGAVTAGLVIATAVTAPGAEAPGGGPPVRGAARPGPGAAGPVPSTPPAPAPPPAEDVRFGAFLGSGPEGVRRMADLSEWLGGREPQVGHTYLPGDLWSNIEGLPAFLRPWAEWRKAERDRLFVLNVPMQERNEEGVPDAEVRRLLRAGAAGRFDHHFRTLAERLVRLGVPDTVVVLGWEMNGTTYTHRCGPDPEAWKAYWRNIVETMRSVPGQDFRFDFAPSRGRDAIGWTECYPGDDVVDIIGMDSYDQPPGETFQDQVRQPFGLRHHVDFARKHGKPLSYPEWGLFREGDNPGYMRSMLRWIGKHKPLYHTITDYCPHGVWLCDGNPASSGVFRSLMEAPAGQSQPNAEPGVEPTPGEKPSTAPSGTPSRQPGPFRFCLDLGYWLERLLGGGPFCFRYEWERRER